MNNLILYSPAYSVTSKHLTPPREDISIEPIVDNEFGVIDIHFKGKTDIKKSKRYYLRRSAFNKINYSQITGSFEYFPNTYYYVDNNDLSNIMMIDQSQE